MYVLPIDFTTNNMKRLGILAVLVALVPLVGMGCIRGASEDMTHDLPDYITEVNAETLPAAIHQARRDERSSVRVSDPDGNVIQAFLEQPTATHYTVHAAGGIDDPAAFIEGIVFGDLREPRNVAREGDDGISFDHNGVRDDDIALVIYEIFIQQFKIDSTSNWTIEILD